MVADSSKEDEVDPLDVFEDGLAIFGAHMPAAGDPGQRITFSHPALPCPKATISYNIPAVHSKSTHLFAHHQWDSGVLLARMIASSSASSQAHQGRDASEQVAVSQDALAYSAANVRGQSVIELGAGTGLPGLVAGLMDTSIVVITDYDDPPLIDTIRANVRSVCGTQAKVHAEGLTWGTQEHIQRALRHSGSRGFSRVLAADTLWVSSAHHVLLQTIKALLHKTSEARVLLLAGFHTGRPAIARFFQMAAGELDDRGNSPKPSAGVDEGALVPDWEDVTHGGIWERHIDGQIRPWQGVRPHAWRRHGSSETSQSQVFMASNAGLEPDEEMGDIEDRAKWVVCASLRWAHLQ